MSDFWYVPLTSEQRRILRRLIREELEHGNPGKARVKKLRTVFNKLSDVRPDYSAKV